MAIRVLVADGSPAIRETIRQHLECIGCEVVAEVESAAQALPLFRIIRPEIVTLGASLTYGGQGTPLDLVRLIKREAPATSVLVVGRDRPPEQRDNFVREGAVDLVNLADGGLQGLWRKLSLIHGELRKNSLMAMFEPPKRAAAARQLSRP